MGATPPKIDAIFALLRSETGGDVPAVASEPLLTPSELDAGLKVVSIPAAAFSDANFGDGRGKLVFHPYHCYISSDGSRAFAHASLIAPDGADLQAVRLYLVDNDPTGEAGFLLYRIEKAAAPQQQQREKVMAGRETVGHSSSLQFLDYTGVVRSVIDNSKYAYNLVVYVPSPECRIYAADVFYK